MTQFSNLDHTTPEHAPPSPESGDHNLDPGPGLLKKDDPTKTVEQLLDHPDLWQAGQLADTEPTHPSGFTSLDTNLPGHGWPQAGLAEFLLSTSGLGELQLLVPLMRQLSQSQQRWLAWVNPPHIPYAPGLTEHGIALDKILLIHPKGKRQNGRGRDQHEQDQHEQDQHKDALWALECAAKSGSCSLVLAWLDERRLTLTDTRRLQLAAKTGNTFVCLFRPESAGKRASMAQLRIRLHASKQAAEHNRVQVSIEKRRRGWPLYDLPMEFQHRPHQVQARQEQINEQLSLWQRLQGHRAAATDSDFDEHTQNLHAEDELTSNHPQPGEHQGDTALRIVH